MTAAATLRARRRGYFGAPAAWLLALLVLGQQSCSSSGTQIEVTLTGVPESASALRVTGFLDMAPAKEPPVEIRKPPASDLTYFRATLAEGEYGQLRLNALVLGSDSCAVAQGETTLTVDQPGTYSATIAVTETTGCQLVIHKVGEGAGRVRVINQDTETSFEFTRPPQEILSCPLAANYPSSQTLTLPLRSHVQLVADVTNDPRGSIFGAWGQACGGRGACEVDISEASQTLIVSFYSSLLCTPSGICWRHPLPQGNNLLRVSGRGAVDVWASGERGTILHWNGSYWSTPRRPFDANTINGQWVASNPRDSLLFVGEQGIARPFSMQTWACSQSVGAVTLRDAWGTADNDLWAVGDQGAIAHWDGTQWTRQVAPTGAGIGLSSILGRSAQDIWAVGEQGTVLRYDGARWSRVPVPVTDTLFGLWLGSSEAWAVGDNGVTLRIASVSGGLQTEVRKSGTTARLYGIFGVAADELWAVGAFGTILRGGTSASWSLYASDTTADLLSVWGGSADDIWAVGTGGALVHYNGGYWQSQSISRTSETLNGLWGAVARSGQPQTEPGLLAVGDRGQILRWTGSDWVLAVAPSALTPRSLRAAWGSSPSDTWIVGDAGTAVRWNGAQASLVATGISSDLHALWGQSASDIYAVGQSGTLARYDGTRWTAATLPAAAGVTLRAIWGASASELWIAGDSGTLLRWNGSTATAVPSGTLRNLRALSGTAPTDVWSVGDGGTLLHYNGAATRAAAAIVPFPAARSGTVVSGPRARYRDQKGPAALG